MTVKEKLRLFQNFSFWNSNLRCQLAIIILTLFFMVVFSGCIDGGGGQSDEELTENMVSTFKASYSDVLALDANSIDDTNFHDYADKVDSALLIFGKLTSGAQKELAAQKAHLDSLAVIIGGYISSETVFFISPDGDDNNHGTKASPFLTIGRAEQAVPAGGTVYIRGGVYLIMNQSGAEVFLLYKSGTPIEAINYLAYPQDDERPVFDLSGLVPGTEQKITVFRVTGSNRYFYGIDVRGVPLAQTAADAQSECFYNAGNNNVYENITVSGGMGIGFFIASGSNNLVLNCDAYNNKVSLSNDPRNGNVDGFASQLSANTAAGNVFRGCRAWLNSGNGFDLSRSFSAVTVDNCLAFFNGYGDDPSGAITVGDQKLRSLADGKAGFSAGGYGMDAAGTFPSTAPRHTVQMSLSFYNNSFGFFSNHHLGGINLYNNTAFMEAENFNLRNRQSAAGVAAVNGYNHEMINNLSYKPRTAGKEITEIDIGSSVFLNNSFGIAIKESNVWQLKKVIEISDDDFINFDWTELKRDRKADGSLTFSGFLRPADNSRITGQGQRIPGIKYSGSAPNIGCF